MGPSKGYNLASGTLFHMKLTGDIEQELRKTMLASFGHQSGFTQVKRIKRLFLAQLEKTIVPKQQKEPVETVFVRVSTLSGRRKEGSSGRDVYVVRGTK